VSLDMTTLTIMRILPREVDPMVRLSAIKPSSPFLRNLSFFSLIGNRSDGEEIGEGEGMRE
jgi:hypothetical protein